MAANNGASDVYQGGSGVDTLTLELTTAEWFKPDVQTDIANYLAFQAAHTDPITGEADSAVFQFTAFDLSASEFEALNVIVDGVVLDPTDEAVTAVNDSATLNEDDTATTFTTVLGNDSVPDLVYSVAWVSGPAQGTLVFNPGLDGAPDGSYSFDPNDEFEDLAVGESRNVSFVYEVRDADGDTNQATVTITVTGTNDAPTVAAAVANTTNEDAASFNIDMLAGATDVDAGETATLNVQNVMGLVDGVTLSGSTLTVDPANAVFQHLCVGDTDVITVNYDVVDVQGATVAQSATITINGTNDAPVFVLSTPAPIVRVVEDFEGGATGWSDNTTRDTGVAPLTASLGNFGGGQSSSKTFGLSGNQSTVTVAFDVYEFSTWDAEEFVVLTDDVEIEGIFSGLMVLRLMTAQQNLTRFR